MKIPLNEFEQLIDENILKRGLTYFESGAVTDFSEISNDEYKAVVSGTEEYTVHLKIKNNTVNLHHCNCPYDLGSICKHEVAVIFHFQKLAMNQPSLHNFMKTKSVDQQVKALLKIISHNELIDFVSQNSKKDKKFRDYLLASFTHLSQNQSKEFY